LSVEHDPDPQRRVRAKCGAVFREITPEQRRETRRSIQLVALQFERVALDHGGHNFE
jgi:hypothetical protein